jgi:hypothetical protein
MVGMLENLGPALRNLKIVDSGITDSWMRILLSIQQHALQLGRLHIGSTYYAWMKNTLVYQGITEVRLGIEGCIQALK